jgi:metal-responsive CopG/Arc/MetJ family transcriptional regulator
MYEGKSDWITVKLQVEIVREIDKVVSRATRLKGGVPRFRSRSDFVKEACLKYLEAYKQTTKNLGEEIPIVTRK